MQKHVISIGRGGGGGLCRIDPIGVAIGLSAGLQGRWVYLLTHFV